jgi:hypothetical protein
MSYRSLRGNFERPDFLHCIVRIKQGKECMVEYVAEGDSVLKPHLIINGTLRAEMDSAYDPKHSGICTSGYNAS